MPTNKHQRDVLGRIDARLTKMDHSDVCALFEQELGRLPRPGYIERCIEAYPSAGAWLSGRLIGFCYTDSFAPDILEISNILVDKRHRDRHVGAHMLQAVEDQCPGRYTAIILVNSMLYQTIGTKRPASSFYLAHGYTAILNTRSSTVFAKDILSNAVLDTALQGEVSVAHQAIWAGR